MSAVSSFSKHPGRGGFITTGREPCYILELHMKVVAFKRELQGSGASRRLRISGQTPGIIYGGTEAPVTISLDHNALYHALKKEVFHSSILDLEIDGKTQQVLLRDFQVHAYKQLVLHADFQRVDANTKVHMKVALHFANAEVQSNFHVHFSIRVNALEVSVQDQLTRIPKCT